MKCFFTDYFDSTSQLNLSFLSPVYFHLFSDLLITAFINLKISIFFFSNLLPTIFIPSFLHQLKQQKVKLAEKSFKISKCMVRVIGYLEGAGVVT